MKKVDRFWSYEASNIRCVREFDYDTALIALEQSDAAHARVCSRLDAERLRADTAVAEVAALREELASLREALIQSGDLKNGLQQSLTAAEQRNADLRELLSLIRNTRGTMLMTDPPQDPWKYHRIEDRIRAALKPTESGASECSTN